MFKQRWNDTIRIVLAIVFIFLVMPNESRAIELSEKVSVSSFEELKIALDSGAENIEITENIDVVETLLIKGSVTINGNREGIVLKGKMESGPILKTITRHSGDITINNLIIDGNEKSSGVSVETDRESYLALNNVSINNCSSKLLEEGALFIMGNRKVTINKCNFDNNIHGTVFVGYDPDVIIDNSIFSNNKMTSFGFGGAITFSSHDDTNLGKVDITNTDFINNSCENIAGAINLVGSEVNIDNCNFVGNTSKSYGGAIYIQKMYSGNIKNCTFDGNKSTNQDGGAIDNRMNYPLEISDCVFENNKSARNGGAINILKNQQVEMVDSDYKFYEHLKVLNTSFSDNFAKKGIFELKASKYPSIFGVYNSNVSNIDSLSAPAKLDRHTAYNNYDISFVSDDLIVPSENYSIIYDGNGNTNGSVPEDNNEYEEGSEVVVLDNIGNLVKDNCKFSGWNTKADGTGITYRAEDILLIRENVVLYAMWEAPDEVKEDSDYDMSFLIWDWSPAIEIERTILHRAYINGYPDGTIRPKGEITRGEVAAIISRLHSNTEEIEYGTENIYFDVKPTDWYSKHVKYVTDNKLMNGYEDGMFRPEAKITRGEYATVIARYNSLEGIETTFEDSKNHWSGKSIGAVYAATWVNGYLDGTFRPSANISREEVVTMTNKMLERRIDKNSIEHLVISKFIDLEHDSWSYYDLIEASNTHEMVKRNSDFKVEDWKAVK